MISTRVESIVQNIQTCRICSSTDLTDVISLGEQYITSRFPVYGDFSTPKTQIDLCVCANCRLLQLRQTTFSSELYEYEYGYRSGISNTMRQHLKEYQTEILSKVNLLDGDTIVDIGSNDSTMLQYYSKSMNRIGVDPTGSQFAQYYGTCQLLPTYFTLSNFQTKFGETQCKIVSSISMFYDLPEPVQFAKDIYSILEEDGIWTCEQSYLPKMLKTNSIDTICHEHLEYYSLKQVKYIADQANFKIIDVKFNECNGGSFRVYFAKRVSNAHMECSRLIEDILQEEAELGLNSNEVFEEFMERCRAEVLKLKDFIDIVNRNGQTVYIYGASTKGNCLLQFANMGEDRIPYAVERNPKKVGKMAITGIPIISEETMREAPPDFMLVLPWHFKEEILVRETEFLKGGGQFIFPFPEFSIVGAKPKLLITGCDGMIGQHVLTTPDISDYNVYGFGHLMEKYTRGITKFYLELNSSELEHALSMVKPDVVIHLAGLSNSQYTAKNPVETVMTNGLVTVRICDWIRGQGLNTKLFNASSSEIYKGHIDYRVTENDIHKYHNHPYSIAKTVGHSTVDYFRETYGCLFSNGVIFTTESKLKKPTFLLNKVAKHIREWKAAEGELPPLKVGNLDSYRNILHASDVASAIMAIVQQDKADDYLICHTQSYKVKSLVLSMFEKSGIQVEERDNTFVDKSNNKILLAIQEHQPVGFDSTPTHITGEPTRLNAIGWTATIGIDDILNEILEK